MRIIAPMMILIMMTSTLAGCTGGDPDGGGNDEIDMDVLNQLIDDNLQDFINNTTIDVTNNYHDSDNSTIINYINGTSTMVSTLHTMTGNHEGYSSQYNHEGGILVLLVREDSFPQDDAGGIFLSLDGGNFCLNVGSEIEVELQTSFSYHGIEFTSIGTENILESKDKLISGECDAIAGDISAMMSVKNSLDNETSIQGGIWITNSIAPYSST
ncbi:hypothetical protein N9347_05985, partial [Euryarchaeota archaeon]|nr:hypothetical protein [Euryarchaeota archaeon]